MCRDGMRRCGFEGYLQRGGIREVRLRGKGLGGGGLESWNGAKNSYRKNL
jgi:hypothetical protein